MRFFALPLAALALMGADEPPAGTTPEHETCRDRIGQARAASGQPPLMQRGPASPDDPVMIYAVDRRQDGCAVMVVKGDPGDIRPLPEAPEGGKLFRRAIPSQ